jgi:hypothetical protein
MSLPPLPCLVRRLFCQPLVPREFFHLMGGVNLDGFEIKVKRPDSQTFILGEYFR